MINCSRCTNYHPTEELKRIEFAVSLACQPLKTIIMRWSLSDGTTFALPVSGLVSLMKQNILQKACCVRYAEMPILRLMKHQINSLIFKKLNIRFIQFIF